jgi:hypothetical protein
MFDVSVELQLYKFTYLDVAIRFRLHLHRYFHSNSVGTIFALYLAGAFHVIDTGHIGVYKRGGAMLNTWTEPGLHFMIPFITKVLVWPFSITPSRSLSKQIRFATFL